MEITEREARYLKLMYRKQREEDIEIGTTQIAKTLEVSPGTVTETLQNLHRKGLLNHEPYHGVDFTKKGITKTRKLLRKHRILETLFVNFLNYSSEKACNEASNLDYHASETFIKSICRFYGHPEVCPCGKKIFKDLKCRKTNRGDEK